MKRSTYSSALAMLLTIAFTGLHPVHAQEGEPSKNIPARMTVTLRVLGKDKRTPNIGRDDVVVKQGKMPLHVTRWEPATGSLAGLDLFILLDDASDFRLGSYLDELRTFIVAQPPSTVLGVGYMRNGTVQIVQDFTTNHEQAAAALRLPLANTGIYGSPYLSSIDLMKRWPQSGNRREIVMVTDGIDRLRPLPYNSYFGYTSPDVESASRVAQRTGTIIDTIFIRGVGRWANNYWEINNGQTGITRLSDATGGNSYFLGHNNPVSFKPYLDNIQMALDNQYLLEFLAPVGKRSGIQYVNLNTPIPGIELDSADGVWVERR